MSAPVTTNNNPQTTTNVVINSTQVLPQALPQLAIGDVVRLTVRQNFGDGQGQLYFKGQLIDASIPPHLANGDKLLAKILLNNDQLLFQILDHQKTQSTSTNENIKTLESKLASLLQELPTPALRNNQTMALPASLQQLGIDQALLQNLFSQLITPDQLQNPQALLSQMQSTKDGSLPHLFRQAAEAINQFLEQQQGLSNQNFLEIIKGELTSLLEKGLNNNPQLLRQLNNLVSVLTDELGQTGAKNRPEAKLLEQLTKELRDILSSPEQQTDKLESTLRQLINNPIFSEKNQQLSAQAKSELAQLATRFEQLATTFETLNQLNPLMQAMGEPALMLFPFLLHGLISHSEVTVQTKHPKKRKDLDGDEESENQKSNESFQRIQVTVPLPNFGEVDVDIAHRPEEILVRFAVDSQEKIEFIVEQLEHLGTVLREQGFKKTELMATVGQKKESMALWTIGLSSMGSKTA